MFSLGTLYDRLKFGAPPLPEDASVVDEDSLD